jgi:tRNA threonylcarbamoyladenosine biosynthesis protein TsaE
MPRAIDIALPDTEATEDLGRRIGHRAAPGDLLILAGDLGAGKTTLTRGIGEGLGVRGPVTSPTFVIARRHPSLTQGPALVHVDAYRVGSIGEIDDLDLEAEDAVLVVEWGVGLVEHLADTRLEVHLSEFEGGRIARCIGYGDRWDDAQLVNLQGDGS